MRNYEIIDEFGYTNDFTYLYDVLDLVVKKFDIDGIFSITFMGDEEIHKMNLEYRGIDRTTDVLSFAFNDTEDNFENIINVLGDIFISIPKMMSQAEEYGHSEKRELSFLCIHGLLHLLGYDHQTKEEELVMFKLQEEVLEDANIKK